MREHETQSGKLFIIFPYLVIYIYIYKSYHYCKSYQYGLIIIVKMVFIKNCKIRNFDKQEKIN